MCRSPGWPPTASTVSAWSRWICARRARATCWGWRQITSLRPGLASRQYQGRPKRSCRHLMPPLCRALLPGEGVKGPRLYDWGYLELADLDASDSNSEQSGVWTRGLLIRRNLADGECAYFTTWCPAGTGIETLVAVEGQRWTIEDGFEASKNELGLDHNETRSWHGWHRHVAGDAGV